MATAEELSAAVAAHEAHIVTLTARVNEMREHQEQAGVRLHAPEAQLRAGASAGGNVKLTLGKEMMPDSFNSTHRVKFSDWDSRCRTLERCRLGDILEWITQQENDVPEDRFDSEDGSDKRWNCVVLGALVHCVEQSYRRGTAC